MISLYLKKKEKRRRKEKKKEEEKEEEEEEGRETIKEVGREFGRWYIDGFDGCDSFMPIFIYKLTDTLNMDNFCVSVTFQ